ncbi:MAG: YceG family protein [Candidatus Roizmanbacteria bacterium GW2011_GWA2_33_33]|uniref:Endolytic murein transglycosylase n=2 Tax=Candidatus Roizmaniibacteriota TaxID=1752723 RepID=A0A0G0DI16_9BACT|nr:MAG: YceG family protein [Candidatus Roizmanbacteria bacterium GW2011_GWA2_33_33]KKP62775.1 MAG: YceG family protein [Candidatus Roizmanbacteria bacterium GW2011_GWC2_34_23]
MKKTNILLFLLVIISISFYFFYSEGSLPVNKSSKVSKIFIIKQGEPLNLIVNNLASEGLIRNKIIFYLIVKKLGIERKIQAGDFRISENMSAQEVATNLTHGTIDIWLTLIEGMRKEEMAQIISKTLDIPEIEIVRTTNEGYIFPDTYLVPRTATSEIVLSIINKNFESKFDEKLHTQAKNKKLTEKQVLILASLVEREARQSSTREKVAGIILKRYLADWPLQIDATVQYVLGYQPNEKSWWKKELTEDDLKIDSPYNTYKNKGLPPEPIANPSLSSIKAVINANENTPYWYYLTDKNGIMHYAVTLEEHETNVQKYLQ